MLSVAEKQSVSRQLCDCVRLVEGELVLEFTAVEPDAAEPVVTDLIAADVEADIEADVEAEVVPPSLEPGTSSLSVCGARVDGKLLLLWVVAHGEGQLLVHGFDPQSSQRMGQLVLGPEDWSSPTGYGALAELGVAETQQLCGQICGMLKLDSEGSALLLALPAQSR